MVVVGSAAVPGFVRQLADRCVARRPRWGFEGGASGEDGGASRDSGRDPHGICCLADNHRPAARSRRARRCFASGPGRRCSHAARAIRGSIRRVRLAGNARRSSQAIRKVGSRCRGSPGFARQLVWRSSSAVAARSRVASIRFPIIERDSHGGGGDGKTHHQTGHWSCWTRSDARGAAPWWWSNFGRRFTPHAIDRAESLYRFARLRPAIASRASVHPDARRRRSGARHQAWPSRVA